MNRPAYLDELKRLAPSIAFGIAFDIDDNFVWDGDGPNPEDDGYIAYDTTYSASIIIFGEIYTEETYMGGSYYQHAEFDLDTHGYTPQHLQEAAERLLKHAELGSEARRQVQAAIAHLHRVMKETYAAQQTK